MKASTVRDKIMKEIELVPEHKLSELYLLVHRLRAQSEVPSGQAEKIMALAGCWQDMRDEEFEGFFSEISERRRATSARRRRLEAGND